MKEYIAKEELLKRKRYINLANTPWNFIDDCHAVTEADICREFKLEVLKNIEIGIENTGHIDQYSTGFCNALIWLRSCITGEEPKFLGME